MKLSLGFSPCPNDTFIFDAIINGKIDTKGISFDYVMEDVETLNQMAFEEKLDITKLSYGTFLKCTKPYALLHSGSALGKGVGPLLVSKTPIPFEEIHQLHIAIPGVHTTANLLLSLAAPQAIHKTELVFSEIEQAVLKRQFEAGLIIHESRFTYAQKGLYKIIDLGDWWENTIGAAIPLGGIVMKRSFDKTLIQQIDVLIQQSLQYAWRNYPILPEFVHCNAQEMEEAVMRQHIELYVNEYTHQLGKEGEHAIQTLFDHAYQSGIIREQYSLDKILY